MEGNKTMGSYLKRIGYFRNMNIRTKFISFRNMNIRTKFISIFIPILTILVAMILFITNTILYNSNIYKTKAIVEDECEIIRVRLESMKRNIVTCANVVTKDINRVYSDTNIANPDDISFVTIKNNIYTALDYEMRCFDDISSILFVDTNGNMVSVGLNEMPGLTQIENDFLTEIPPKGLPGCIQFPVAARDYFEADEPVLTLGKRIIMMETGMTVGHILLNVKESKVSSIFPEYQEEETARQFFLTDRKYRIVSAMDKATLLSEVKEKALLYFLTGNYNSSERRIEKENFLFLKKRVENLDWNLVCRVSINSLTADIRFISGITVLLGAFGMLIAVILTILLSKRITRPIAMLTNAALRLQEGDFSVNCEMDSRDEVGIFSKTFQAMIIKIEGLILQVSEEQKKKREFELALIQSQIKPHFLYNTLDLIYIFSESEMSGEAAKVTKSLADFYRTSLSSGKEVVTIGEEIQNVQNYLYIQRERYYDIMDYEITCDPMITEYKIMKLLLQPLVENAIYHGLRPKGEKGKIEVTGKQKENEIVLTVKDSGVGMSEEEIQKMMEVQEDDRKEHFGMRNVRQRLKLYYGTGASMEIYSKMGAGTEIVIRVLRTMGEELC